MTSRGHSICRHLVGFGESRTERKAIIWHTHYSLAKWQGHSLGLSPLSYLESPPPAGLIRQSGSALMARLGSQGRWPISYKVWKNHLALLVCLTCEPWGLSGSDHLMPVLVGFLQMFPQSTETVRSKATEQWTNGV